MTMPSQIIPLTGAFMPSTAAPMIAVRTSSWVDSGLRDFPAADLF
jgi:hypothetical protein